MASRSILGKTIQLDNESYTMIGVLPLWFRFPGARVFEVGEASALKPEVFCPLVFSREDLQELMGNFNYAVIERLKRGVSADQSLAELNVIAAQLAKMAGEKMEIRASVIPMRESIVGKSRRGLWVLLEMSHSAGAGPRRPRRRTLRFQKLKDSFIDHRRLCKGQIVTSARNYLSRDLGSHSLQATHSLFGRVNDLVFTRQEQCGRPQTSPFGIGQHWGNRSLVPLDTPHVQRQLLDRRVNPLRIRSRHIRKDPPKKRSQAPLSGYTERDQAQPKLDRGAAERSHQARGGPPSRGALENAMHIELPTLHRTTCQQD